MPHPGGNALPNKLALELGHRADDLEHKPAGRHAEVEILAHADEGYVQGLEFYEGIEKVIPGSVAPAFATVEGWVFVQMGGRRFSFREKDDVKDQNL